MFSNSIDRLRELFEQELTLNSSAYNPIDIERVRTEEWQVKRFLLEYLPDEQKAFDAMCKSLKWKHSFGVHERTNQYFPKELWTLNGLEMIGQDRVGRLIVWSHSRNQKKFKELTKLLILMSAHRFEQADRLAGEKGCIMVADCKGSSLLNIDRELAHFSLELVNYYPQLVRESYTVNLPAILNPLMKMLLGLMNAKQQSVTHFISVDQLGEVVDIEHIPVRLNGKRQVEVYPDNLVQLELRFRELELEQKFVDHYYKTFNLKRIGQM